jgi:pyruvate ferredoxin oxidoreductase delta subunit
MSIISADKKMVGVDYEHCKGCGVCVDVCPTNPKSLLMFEEQTAIDEAVASWPAKEDKKKGE